MTFDGESLKISIKESMEKSIAVLQQDLAKIRTGVANTSILADIRVDSYGSKVPVNQVASVAAPESRLITINPYDKSHIGAIEKAILTSALGLTPQNDGKIIRLQLPILSEDRRKNLVKDVKKLGEEFKISLRGVRQDANEKAKAAVKQFSFPEDASKQLVKDLQDITDGFIKKIESLVAAKEKEILNV
jgi:ribosome recycling factor